MTHLSPMKFATDTMTMVKPMIGVFISPAYHEKRKYA